MIIADLEKFTDKGKPITYIGVYVKLYNKKNNGQVYEIHGIVELKKMYASIAKYLYNFGAHYIVEISSILCSIYVVPKDQEKIVFNVNNYINWNQFNQLYAPDLLEKGI